MSKDQVVAFGKKVNESSALMEKVKAAGADIDAVVALGREEGFSFTSAELQEVVSERAATDGVELTEMEMEQIAGGTYSYTQMC